MRKATLEDACNGINPRKKLSVRITNYWGHDGFPSWEDKPRRLTPRRALELYIEYHPQGSTHFTAFEAIDSDDREWDIGLLRLAYANPANVWNERRDEMSEQITVYRDKGVGVYGHDEQGNPWASFQFYGVGHTDCSICGLSITHGWKCGKYGDTQKYYCPEHIKQILPEKEKAK